MATRRKEPAESPPAGQRKQCTLGKPISVRMFLIPTAVEQKDAPYRLLSHLVVDEDEDDVRLAAALRSRLVVGSVCVAQVGFGLLSRQDVQAAEEAPQNDGGRRRLHVGPRNPAEISREAADTRMSRVGTNSGSHRLGATQNHSGDGAASLAAAAS